MGEGRDGTAGMEVTEEEREVGGEGVEPCIELCLV